MYARNDCYTYFTIVGEFDPDEMTQILGLTPEKKWGADDTKGDGSKYGFAHWEIGRCTDYDFKVENQMEKTISVLEDKIEILNFIREHSNVEFYLAVVPFVCPGEVAPCLAPSLRVIDFCHATRTKIDIDLYVWNSEEE